MKRTVETAMHSLRFFLSLASLTLICGCSRQAAESVLVMDCTPLPSATVRELDTQAAELFVKSKDTPQLAERKAAITQALAIEGISFAMRTVLERERMQIEEEETALAARKSTKPRTSFQAVSIPKQRTVSRYGVNMNELMKTVNEAGITKDPFLQ